MGDVVRAPWNAYFVTGFDTCSEVLRGRNWLAPDFAWQERQADTERWDAVATQEMTKTLSRLNAPEHTCQRRSLGNLFDRSTIQRLTPQVEEHVTRLLDELADKLRWGETDFVSTVSEQLPISTIGSWLGVPPEDYSHILEITHNQVHAQELLPTKSELAVSAEATVRLRSYFTDMVKQRRANPGNDVLTGWIHTWDAMEPDREAADEILYRLTMFVTIASLETTATLLSTMVGLLLRSPAGGRGSRSTPDTSTPPSTRPSGTTRPSTSTPGSPPTTRSWRACRSRRTAWSTSCTGPPTTTPGATRTRIPSTSSAPAPTSPSGAVCTTAWARPSPALRHVRS